MGYAVISSALLAVGVLVIGGWDYVGIAGLLIVLSLMFLARANHLRKRGRDERTQSEHSDADKPHEQREKEMEAEKSTWGFG